ncbi:SufD family Fe-S cluster assembly protein [Candidatus Woesearchaeota archaeon]|nr:SufD family Fe-S cluster assembly protein [Candidatus Woesearchaeota archaeon]
MVKFGNLVGIKINKTINNHKRASMFGIDKKFAYVPIKKITKKKTKNKEVYNFGVEGHETYTAGSVIVHNCSAPKYKSPSIHAGCVEVIVHKGARMRYSSVENWSRNTYNLNTKRANVYEEGIMEWVSGNLGCLAGDTKISTNPKGPTKIMELKPGDYVYALNEKTNKLEKAKIKQKIYSGDKKTYRLKAGGREIEATGNHPFLALTHKKNNPNHKKGFFRTEWKKLEDLKKGDLIAIAKSLPVEGIPYKLPSYNYNKQVKSKNQYTKEFSMSINHLYKKIKQPKETNEDLMWLLGILLGDGHIYLNKKNAKINIAIPEKDSLRKEVKTAVKKLFHIDVKYEKDRFLVINSRPLADLIIKIGFSGKADTKKIPPWVHKLPKKQKMALLAGYIDSDGHIGEGGAYITSINKEILEDIQEIALSCGIGFSNVFVHGKKRKTKILGIDCNANDSYRILLNGKNVKEIPIKNKEKKEKLKIVKTKRNYVSSKGKNFRSKTTDEIGFTTIKDIIPTGIKPTFDIEVEKHHNFVAEGMIVHNSGITMLYPASLLLGRKSQGHHVTIAYAGPEQNQDTGAKIYHLAPDTTSTVKSKSISKDGGITAYRGIVEIKKGATNAKCSVHCDAMMFDNKSQSNTYPTIKVEEKDADMVHEATIGKISEDQIFYLMSRGLSEEDALKLIVSGFIEPLMKELPLEYAIEMNKLIQMEMEGSLG